MDMHQIKYFLSAASIGNFTFAALENNISQSSFSKQIMNLENELGTELFIRKKRNIELTPAGEQFQEYAFRMLSTYEEMLRGMESFSAFQTLPVNIASIPVIQSYNLKDMIFDLKQKYPELLFSVSERAESSEVMHLLHRGECDFAVLRTDFLEKDKYNIYPIVKDRLAVVLHADNPLTNKKRVSIKELKNEHFVMPPAQSDLRIISQNACIANGFRPEIAYITSGNVNLSLDFVERQKLAYLAFYDVISYYMAERSDCKVMELEESIESFTAFVSIKNRHVTRAQEKVACFLEKRLINTGSEHVAIS